MLTLVAKILKVLISKGPNGVLMYARNHFEQPAAINRMDEIARSELSISEKFSAIYDEKLWFKVQRHLNPDGSLSGQGSTLESTEVLRGDLEKFLSDVGAKVFLDAPCGDFNWMAKVVFPERCAYIGGDVVPSVIATLKRKYESGSAASEALSRRFDVIDLTKDRLPDADAWLCKDCLQHLSFRDVQLVLKNALKANINYFLLSNHYGISENVDIETGQFRNLDLTMPPFNLPKPSLMLNDRTIDEEKRYVGVWRREELRSVSQLFEMV